MAEDSALLERVKALAPGYYTERDGGPWYIVTPDHGERIGEDFGNRDRARQAMCSVAGDAWPEGWHIDNVQRVHCDLHIPGQYSPATLWLRTIAARFPDAIDRLPRKPG